jgi:hypothetical protein
MRLVVVVLAMGCGRVAFEPRTDALEIDASTCVPDLRLGAVSSGDGAFTGTASGYAAAWREATTLRLALVRGDNTIVRAKVLGTASEGVLPAMAALGDDIAVAWLTPTLLVSIEQPDGLEIARPPIGVGQPGVSSPALASIPGTYMVAWTDTRSGTRDVLVQSISASGALGTPRNVGLPAKATPAIAGRADRFLVAYVEQENIYVIAVDPTGSALGAPILVETSAFGPALAASSTGFGMVSIEPGALQQRLLFRELDPDGMPIGGSIAVGTMAGFYVKAAIAWDGARYVIAGTHDTNEPTAPGDLAFRMVVEPGGTVVGTPTRIGRPSGDTRGGDVGVGPAGPRFMAIEERIGDGAPQAYVMCVP